MVEKNQLKLEIFKADNKKILTFPFASACVQAGFPSPADDHIEKKLDLNELLIAHPAATFFVRVEGNSMIDANIHSGDVLIIDRALTPSDNKIIVAVLNGEFTVKRIQKQDQKLFLLPENPTYPPIKVTPEMDFEVWGVVTYIIHKAT